MRSTPSLSSFPNVAFETSSSAFSFSSSLLQAIIGVMSLALCPQVVSQASHHFRSSEKHPLVRAALPANLSARSFPFTPACPGQYTRRSFRRWMSTIDTFHSRLPIPIFTFCSKLIESVRMMACVVWLSPLESAFFLLLFSFFFFFLLLHVCHCSVCFLLFFFLSSPSLLYMSVNWFRMFTLTL